MAKKPNTALRIIVPVVMIALGVLLAVAVFRNTVNRGQGQQTPQQQAQQSATAAQQSGQQAPASDEAPTGQTSETAEPAAEPSEQTPAVEPEAAPVQPQVAAPTGLRPRVVPTQSFDPIGSPDPQGDYELFVEFAVQDAGVKQLLLSRQFKTIQMKEQEILQDAVQPTGGFVAPFGAVAVDIAGTGIGVGYTAMQSAGGQVWEQLEPGHFRATIVDENDEPVLQITRRFVVTPGSFDLRIDQQLTNLTDAPLPVRWYQWGPVDLPQGFVGYGGDKRRLRFGYLRSPTSQIVETSDSAPGMYARMEVVKQGDTRVIWPNEQSSKYNFVLAWAALTNRYYALAVHPWIDPDNVSPGDLSLSAVERVDRYLVGNAAKAVDKTIILRLVSPQVTIPPGESADASLGVYAGPLSASYMSPASEPVAAAAQLDEIIIYTFGGMCSFCTFQWLAVPLRMYLGFLDQYVVFDWALAIIVLVLTVRTLLHPITRFSQIRMHKFGKVMQSLGPKLQKIKEKYPNEPRKQQEEMQRLYREEGINPAHALGCLPLFLQTPIWIALYAMLFFTFELRHESAFFGVFQFIKFNGEPWTFLGDLAEPDRFILFSRAIHIPLISNLMGPITSFNILPLVYAGVFFVHQKFLTPPTTGTLSPEQESAQKMARYMPLVLFPLFIYNAPSGLAIYFICNSIIAIVESKLIRRKADKLAEEEAKNPRKKKPAGEGFMARVMRLAEERRKMMEEAQRLGGQGPGRGRNKGGRGKYDRRGRR